MDLFSFNQNEQKVKPLAEKMRPTTLSAFIGQKHLIGKGKPLAKAIEADALSSCIFYGKSGCGKTTLAQIIAKQTNGHCIILNAAQSGMGDIKKAIEEAKEILKLYHKRTYLLVDECHRYNKVQLDSLLPVIENGSIVFIGSTTENPSANLTPALLSRCHVFNFYPLEEEEIKKALKGALSAENGLKIYNLQIAEDALVHIAKQANGDLRIAYNTLEFAALHALSGTDTNFISLHDVEACLQQKALSIDDTTYYDLLSAFCKSLRGSSSDASLYYAFRLIESGVDPYIIFRRLIAHASEDVGIADERAIQVAVAALQAFKELGPPEGYLPLTQAIIYIAEAEKSNSVVLAMQKARELAKTVVVDCPPYLRERGYADTNTKKECEKYLYPHLYGGYVQQQYLPDRIKEEIVYTPTQNGAEEIIYKRKEVRKNKDKK